MLNQSDFFHGVLFTKLLDYEELNIRKHPYFSAYIVNDRVYYIKYSKSRISPWTFSFSEMHVTELINLSGQFENVYIVLICNEDGICCLNFQEFRAVIAIENGNFPKWIKATRQKREKYSVSGSDGKLKGSFSNKMISSGKVTHF